MRRVIIDCHKKEEIWRDLTAQEEAARLAEIQLAIVEKGEQDKRTNKAQLIKALAELREMKQNRGVFSDADIDEKQSEVDALKNRLGG
jgi:hypothetical protein